MGECATKSKECCKLQECAVDGNLLTNEDINVILATTASLDEQFVLTGDLSVFSKRFVSDVRALLEVVYTRLKSKQTLQILFKDFPQLGQLLGRLSHLPIVSAYRPLQEILLKCILWFSKLGAHYDDSTASRDEIKVAEISHKWAIEQVRNIFSVRDVNLSLFQFGNFTMDEISFALLQSYRHSFEQMTVHSTDSGGNMDTLNSNKTTKMSLQNVLHLCDIVFSDTDDLLKDNSLIQEMLRLLCSVVTFYRGSSVYYSADNSKCKMLVSRVTEQHQLISVERAAEGLTVNRRIDLDGESLHKMYAAFPSYCEFELLRLIEGLVENTLSIPEQQIGDMWRDSNVVACCLKNRTVLVKVCDMLLNIYTNTEHTNGMYCIETVIIQFGRTVLEDMVAWCGADVSELLGDEFVRMRALFTRDHLLTDAAAHIATIEMTLAIVGDTLGEDAVSLTLFTAVFEDWRCSALVLTFEVPSDHVATQCLDALLTCHHLVTGGESDGSSNLFTPLVCRARGNIRAASSVMLSDIRDDVKRFNGDSLKQNIKLLLDALFIISIYAVDINFFFYIVELAQPFYHEVALAGIFSHVLNIAEIATTQFNHHVPVLSRRWELFLKLVAECSHTLFDSRSKALLQTVLIHMENKRERS